MKTLLEAQVGDIVEVTIEVQVIAIGNHLDDKGEPYEKVLSCVDTNPNTQHTLTVSLTDPTPVVVTEPILIPEPVS